METPDTAPWADMVASSIGRRRSVPYTASVACSASASAAISPGRIAQPVAPNIIRRTSPQRLPNHKWGVDISYVRTRDGWIYLAVVIDLFSCRIVGDRWRRDLALAALRNALVMRRPPKGSLTIRIVATNTAP